MILGAHQPDLLPWSGFWYKMAHSDLFDIKIYDQFQNQGYQRRVKMRDAWASLPLVGKPSLVSIYDVRTAPDAADRLIDLIRGRYRGSAQWPARGEALLHCIDSARADSLWAFNLSLLFDVRDMLGITTPLAVGVKPTGLATDGLIDVCRQYGAEVYLSGSGGADYMGSLPELQFARQGIRLEWSRHAPTTGDSIVSILMDHEDPMEIVMKEELP